MRSITIKRQFTVWAGAMALLVAFGNPSSSAGAQDVGGLGPKKQQKVSLKASILLPGTLEAMVKGTINSCANAIAGATLKGSKGQRLITSGTLQQSKEKFTEWTYSAEPKDSLRVVDEKDNVITYHIGKIEGTLNEGIFGFLNSPHKLRFRTVSTAGELKVESLRSKSGDWSASRVTVTGTLIFEKKKFTVDLKSEGKHFSQTIAINSTGPGSRVQSSFSVESKNSITTEGTLTGPGFSGRILELHGLQAMVANKQRNSSISRTFDNRWTQDGVKYRYKGHTFKTFGARGMVSKAALQWKCLGTLVRNGKQYGVLRMEIKPYRPIKILLDLPAETIQLEYIPRY